LRAAVAMNLKGSTVLVVDDDQFAVNLLGRMLRGFRIDQTRFVRTAQEARDCLEAHTYDFCICSMLLPDGSGAELIKWIRRLRTPNRFIPILILTTYSQLENVRAIRDAGAHMVVRKPVSPQVLYDRIAWAAKAPRPFVETNTYVGPDRRFKNIGAPDGVGRRDNDSPADAQDGNADAQSRPETGPTNELTEIVNL
jgi:CheY-like chemotaxis protein